MKVNKLRTPPNFRLSSQKLIICAISLPFLLSSCSEQKISTETSEAVEELEEAADEAIDQAKEAIAETKELSPVSTSEEKAVAEAVDEAAIAAAEELEARASEAAAKIKEAVKDAQPTIAPKKAVPAESGPAKGLRPTAQPDQ